MPGYTEKHQQDYMRWVQRRMAARATRTAASKPQALAPPQASSQAMEQARRAHGAYSLTWDEISQAFTLVSGEHEYLLPAVSWTDTDLDRLLRASAWSWASITGNAKAMSLLAPVVQEKVGGSWQRAPDRHPLWAWLADPLGMDAALPYWPWSQLLYVTAVHYYSTGNAYWVPLVSDGGDVLAVTPILTPNLMEADEDPIWKAPILYRLRSAGARQAKTWSPEAMINIMAPSASSFWKGSAPLRAALRSVEIDHVATERQRYNLRNRVSPGLTVALDRPLGPSPEQRKNAKAELIADYQDRESDGLPWIVGSGAKIVPGVTPQELQVFDTKHSSRDEILAVIGMPPPVAGVLDRAILNNYAVSNVSWWNTHLFPVLTQITQSINAQLVQRLYGRSTRLWYDLAGTDVALQLLDARLDKGLKLQQLGYSTNDINEALELAMPHRDYLDIPNQQFVIAGRIEEIQRLLQELQDGVLTPSEPVEPTDTPADEDAPQAAAEGL